MVAVTVWGAAIAAFGPVNTYLWVALVFLAVAGAADGFRRLSQYHPTNDGAGRPARGRLAAFNIFVVVGGPRPGDFEAGVVATMFTAQASVVSGGLLCVLGVGVIAALVRRFAQWRVGDPP
jgi:hypothetical protein